MITVEFGKNHLLLLKNYGTRAPAAVSREEAAPL